MKKLLVILQNAYGVAEDYVPSYSHSGFASSQTGRRLKEFLPDNCTVEIINASPLIGDVADSIFALNPDYVMSKVNNIKPDFILALGCNAHKVVDMLELKAIKSYHPAYRALSKKITGEVKKEIEDEGYRSC